jgi:hypothetical protein
MVVMFCGVDYDQASRPLLAERLAIMMETGNPVSRKVRRIGELCEKEWGKDDDFTRFVATLADDLSTVAHYEGDRSYELKDSIQLHRARLLRPNSEEYIEGRLYTNFSKMIAKCSRAYNIVGSVLRSVTLTGTCATHMEEEGNWMDLPDERFKYRPTPEALQRFPAHQLFVVGYTLALNRQAMQAWSKLENEMGWKHRELMDEARFYV